MAVHRILAPCVGTLSILHVESGAIVAADESVGELEAMKMFIPLPAPVAGTVRWLIKLGEVVGQDDVVAEILT